MLEQSVIYILAGCPGGTFELTKTPQLLRFRPIRSSLSIPPLNF